MNIKRKECTLVATLLLAAAVAGCAQDVGDIDRTQPNRVRKSDLAGTWWMHQKVTSLPGNASKLAGFEGQMMETEKVRFVAEENYLIAYRSYPFLPGSDGDTTIPIQNYDEVYNQDYKGAILAMFPIESHFDIQRDYDTATGEESNVISENTSDRPWYERDYIRVQWNQDPLVNFLWKDLWGTNYDLGYQETDDTKDPQKAPYFEYDSKDRLVYFDAPINYVFQTTRYDLYYNWFADAVGSSEIRIVTSFARDLGYEDDLNNYEPVIYPNQDMNRFGFFRTERMTYDPHTGMTLNSGRIEHAYRHNIWEKAYNIDENGNKTPIAIEDRKVRTIPYYIHGAASDPVLNDMSRQVIDEWNVAFKRAVYLMQHPNATILPLTDDAGLPKVDPANGQPMQANLLTTVDYPTLKNALKNEQDIFVACSIPVDVEGVRNGVKDDPACGAQGDVPRDGDFRKNYLWLVTQRQEVGLLGYCPTAFDPLTGRSISAQAHVYTAPMNYIANNIVDHLRFYKGEYTTEGVRANDAGVASAKIARDHFIDMSQIPSKMLNGDMVSPAAKEKMTARKIDREQKRHSLKRFNYERADSALQKAIDTGLLTTELDEDLLKHAMMLQGVKSVSELDESLKEAASLFNHLSVKKRAEMRQLKNAMSAKGYCFDEGRSIGDTYGRLIDKYKNRSDYDNIYKEIRADVFRATALHEMGHGFGLRHNHSGSYDSMNYFDKYWDLRPDANFKKETIDSVGDLMSLYDYSNEQIAGGMLDNMYSSIMDYASGYTTDNMGLGRYDHAAILYAYSAGTYKDTSINSKTSCDNAEGIFTAGSCNAAGRVISYAEACNNVSGIMMNACFNSSNAIISLPEDGSVSCEAQGGHYDEMCVAGTTGITFNTICLNNLMGQFVAPSCEHSGKGLVEIFTDDNGSALTASNASNYLGELAASLLTHKDTTGTSTLDDQTSIGQNYLELAHYHDIFQPMLAKDYKFLNNRALVRMETYLNSKQLDSKGNAVGSSMIRVPYVFCTDDDRGLLRSCYVWDHGADYMEQVIDHITSYNEEYWFTYFARDRYGWNPYAVADRYAGTFLDLSDYFQNWWIGDYSILNDIRESKNKNSRAWNLESNVATAASNATFNFLANVISTPEYGQFCRRKDNGQLYPLSADDEAREETSAYIRNAYCGLDPEYFYVRQGEGRRRYNRYNPEVGFDYSWYPLEAGHYVTSIYAIMALFDNEASVIADSGDINTYTYGLYDMFTEELTQLANHIYAEEYNYHSPRLRTNGGTDTVDFQGYQTVSGSLLYPALSPAYFEKQNGDYQEYDPLTGLDVNAFASLGATVPMFGACTNSNECVRGENAAGAYCGSMFSSNEGKHCFPYYYGKASDIKCPEGSSPDDEVFGDGTITCLPNTDKAFEAVPAGSNMFNVCASEANCTAVSGAIELYCGKLYNDQSNSRCFPIFANVDSANCPADFSRAVELNDGSATCIPTTFGAAMEKIAASSPCSTNNPHGYCAAQLHCVKGTCQKVEPLVESDSAYSQKIYALYFGTILTGYFGSDSAFHEQFAIYRLGSGETITPPPYYKVVTFEDPFTGQIFAANKLDCSLVSGELPAVCRTGQQETGGALMIERAQRQLEHYNNAYSTLMTEYNQMSDADLNDENSATYKRYMELRYDYSAAKNDLDNTIFYLNIARSIYRDYGMLW